MPYADKEKQRSWYELNRERLRPYKADWARRHAAEARVRYREDPSRAIQRAQANYRARRAKVTPEELVRLRRPENLLESLAYGPGHAPVCLGCGGIFANLARHLTTCPVEPTAATAYRARWGYMKSNPLLSPPERISRRAAQTTPRAKAERGARSDQSAAVLAAGRAAQKGKARGPRRAEQRLRQKGARRRARPSMQKVADSEVLKIMAQNLTIAESARRLGLSQYAYWRRVQGLDPNYSGRVRQQRQAVNRYIFDLRAWLWRQSALPTVARVLDRHAAEMRNRSATAAAFNPFLAALESELRADPATVARLADRTPAKGSPRIRGLIPATAAIALASKVFRRVRTAAPYAPSGGRKRLPPQDTKAAKVGRSVEEALPAFRRLCPEWARLSRTMGQARAGAQLLKMGFAAAQIQAAIDARTSRPLVAARQYVAKDSGLEYDVVAEYHRGLALGKNSNTQV